MVHVHRRRVQQLVEPLRRIPPEQVITVAVDAGKPSAVALVADFTGERLCPELHLVLLLKDIRRTLRRGPT